MASEERPRLVALVQLVARLEEREPFVDLSVVLKHVPAETRLPSSAGEVAALLARATSEGVLLSEQRVRFERESGAFLPTRIYRVNPGHPLVAEALGA